MWSARGPTGYWADRCEPGELDWEVLDVLENQCVTVLQGKGRGEERKKKVRSSNFLPAKNKRGSRRSGPQAGCGRRVGGRGEDAVDIGESC